MLAMFHIAGYMMNLPAAGVGVIAFVAVAAVIALGGIAFKLRNWRNARKVDTVVAVTISTALHAAVLFCLFNSTLTSAYLQGGGPGLGIQLDQSLSRDAGSGGVTVAIADPAEAGVDDPALEPMPLDLPNRALLEVQPAVSVAVEVPKPPDLLQSEDPFAKEFVPARLAGVSPVIPGAVIEDRTERTLRPESGTGRGDDGVASRPAGGRGEGGSAPVGSGSGQDARGSGLANDAGGGGGGDSGSGAGMVMPVYPRESREKGEEGRVVISLTIRADGMAADIKVAESSGYPRLDQAALEAVRNSTFIPATRFGLPIDSTKKIAFTFRLKED